MITRIVKMTFDPQKVDEFVDTFNDSKLLIRNSEGCTHLELLRDINNPNIFFTYSQWKSEIELNKYRNSELFEKVWAKTKILFNAKPEAWSVKTHVSE